MKVTFIYTDYGQYNQNNFNRGVAILSSCLKKEGHDAGLIHISRPIDKKEFIRRVKEQKPDLAAFSFTSNMLPQVRRFSLWLKETRIRALHGGMHPTVAPEDCFGMEGVSAVCRGEGEGAIVDFCKAMESGRSARAIPNIWVREDGKIYKNPCRNLVENLDALPYPDYGLFNYASLEEGFVHKILVTQASRGCSYSCTYCCNPVLVSLYKDGGKFLRHYSVDRLLDEIAWGLKKYPFLKEVRFYDDTLTQDKGWFAEFAYKYKERIGLPYSGNERVENIDMDTVSALKDSGCVSLDIGIESGSRLIRERYMNRHMTGEKIVDAFKLLKSAGINANSFNILGMVGETPETALETIKLNALIAPSITFNAYFYPFMGTRAYEMVIEKKYAVEEGVGSFFERPVVALDTIKKQQLVFFYKYFNLLMKTYGFFFRRPGEASVRIKTLDGILTSKYFPYWLFNILHFGKDEMLVLLRRHPRIYLFIRELYRAMKGRG